MNRKIKFRVWSKRSNCWHPYPNGLAVRITDGALVVSASDKILSEVSDEFVYMQFTGLLDKNGKEIYEGDQLYDPASDVKCYVEFIDGSFCVIGYEKFAVDLFEYLENSSSSTCVIGNIYEEK